tara:strand:+ start:39 stop:959 length:921 start_codon:yes stop_codon:yes gene_type:complete
LKKNSFKNRLRIWLLSHPKYNPYKFSFKKFFRNSTSSFRVLPNFIIIGSGRAGTTALYSYLIQHPSIFAAYTDNNQPVEDLHFFEYMISDKISWYKSHFPTKLTKIIYELKSKNNFVTGEYTSTYMYNRNVPKRISKLLPNVKLIIILRNPVDKAYSTYSQQYSFNEFSSSFEDTIQAEFKRMELCKLQPELYSQNPNFDSNVITSIIRHGIYSEYLEIWTKFFPKNQILIIDSEELKNSTQETVNKVFDFLNVFQYKVDNLSKINVGKYSPINKKSKENLSNFYKPYNEKLNNLLDTKFEWNLEN